MPYSLSPFPWGDPDPAPIDPRAETAPRQPPIRHSRKRHHTGIDHVEIVKSAIREEEARDTDETQVKPLA